MIIIDSELLDINEEALEHQNPRSLFYMGRCYHDGTQVPQNKCKAYRYMITAARTGYWDAQDFMFTQYYEKSELRINRVIYWATLCFSNPLVPCKEDKIWYARELGKIHEALEQYEKALYYFEFLTSFEGVRDEDRKEAKKRLKHYKDKVISLNNESVN